MDRKALKSVKKKLVNLFLIFTWVTHIIEVIVQHSIFFFLNNNLDHNKMFCQKFIL